VYWPGVASVHFVNFRMHPAELGVVVLILAAWAGAVAAFLHKWRRLRIVPPRQLRYKHAMPKNLDAVQVATRHPPQSTIIRAAVVSLSVFCSAAHPGGIMVRVLAGDSCKRSRVRLPAVPLSGNNVGQVVHTRVSCHQTL